MGITILLAGLAVAALAQLYGAFRCFKISFTQGLLCLFIPGWLLFVAKRHGFYGPVVGTWFGGMITAVVGMMIMS